MQRETNMDILMAVIELLGTTMMQDSIVAWLDNPVPALNWATPIEAINSGKGKDVLEVAMSYKEPVY